MNRTALFVVMVILLHPVACPATAGMTLITEEFPPFNYSDGGSLTGVTTQVVREITRRLHMADDIAVMPWGRGYKRLLGEPNVVLFTTARTQERESLFHWVGPLYTVRLGFYARKSDPRRIASLEAAKQVDTIATYKDDFREQLLKSLGFNNLDSSNSPQSDILKLVSGRVDLWFFDNIGAPNVARKAGIDPQEIKEVFTYQQHVSYIAISKQTSPAIVKQWQATLDEMKADGTFWWLTRKWLPSEAILMSDGQNRPIIPYPLELYTEDSPPSSYEENGRIRGLSADVVQEILRRIGQTQPVSLVPWARGFKVAQSNAGAAIFSTTRLPQREPHFHWVGPLYLQRWGFYRWKGSGIAVADLEAAKKVGRIGTYHQDAKMQYLKVSGFKNLVSTNKNITNLMHLQRGDIDLWVSSDFNIPHLAHQAGVSPDQLELAYAFHTVGNYIAFSKTTPLHVIRLWQAVLSEMKADGSYQGICRTYNYDPD
ncbi:substrate-binding periplasmic protein [Desulfosarcina sp.]|uniref:substrate-binding periplasmic protein n=1 Tax=Desulfosarcina sp. TaxID=2027861 RepID=UPI003970B0D9